MVNISGELTNKPIYWSTRPCWSIGHRIWPTDQFCRPIRNIQVVRSLTNKSTLSTKYEKPQKNYNIPNFVLFHTPSYFLSSPSHFLPFSLTSCRRFTRTFFANVVFFYSPRSSTLPPVPFLISDTKTGFPPRYHLSSLLKVLPAVW